MARHTGLPKGSPDDDYLQFQFTMKVIRLWICLVVLLTTAHRLPAPISEAPTPPPAPAKPRAKPPREAPVARKSDLTSKDVKPSRAHQFDGVWTWAADTRSFTLSIKGGETAILRWHNTRSTATYWNDLPEPYDTIRELNYTVSSNSKKLSTTDSTVTVRWNPGRLVEWPKTIPYDVFLAKVVPDEFASERVEVFTLNRGELISALHGFVYHRVR
jgi:hypothetical protein